LISITFLASFSAVHEPTLLRLGLADANVSKMLRNQIKVRLLLSVSIRKRGDDQVKPP
jgi:hypothetical protein